MELASNERPMESKPSGYRFSWLGHNIYEKYNAQNILWSMHVMLARSDMHFSLEMQG